MDQASTDDASRKRQREEEEADGGGGGGGGGRGAFPACAAAGAAPEPSAAPPAGASERPELAGGRPQEEQAQQQQQEAAPAATTPAAAAAAAPLQPAGGAAPPPAAPPPAHTPVAHACSEDKGCRQAMEDAWVALPDARADPAAPLRCACPRGGGVASPGPAGVCHASAPCGSRLPHPRARAARPFPPAPTPRVAFFAVFDGHGGRAVAAAAAERLHEAALAAGLVPPEVRRGTGVPGPSAAGPLGAVALEQAAAAALGKLFNPRLPPPAPRPTPPARAAQVASGGAPVDVKRVRQAVAEVRARGGGKRG
jgi:hypothetical protein